MKKIVLYVPAILLLFLCRPAMAQKDKPVIYKTFNEFNLRTSLTSFLDPQGGLMLGLGYRWNSRFSVSIEPTWIFFTGIISSGEGIQKPSGIKLRGDIKLYLLKRNEGGVDFFIGPEFHYKSITQKKEATFGINCQNGQCAYFQQAFYTDVRKEIGGFLKMGILTKFPFVQSDKLLLEIYLGLGGKQLKFSEKDLPIGGSFVILPPRTPFGQPSNEYGLPTLPAGLKLVYIL